MRARVDAIRAAMPGSRKGREVTTSAKCGSRRCGIARKLRTMLWVCRASARAARRIRDRAFPLGCAPRPPGAGYFCRWLLVGPQHPLGLRLRSLQPGLALTSAPAPSPKRSVWLAPSVDLPSTVAAKDADIY